MVISSERNSDELKSNRYLDAQKIARAIDIALQEGAQYAEARLVAITETDIRMKDSQIESAVPGQQVGLTLRVLVDGSWGIHSTTDYHQIHEQVPSTVKLAKAVAERRSANMKPIDLAEVPIYQDEVHWEAKKDVRYTELEEKLSHMRDFTSSIKHDSIQSVKCGWMDEHIHTELMTSEGMDRVWSFQRTLMHATLEGRDGDNVMSYRTRVGGEGGVELIDNSDLDELATKAEKSTIRLLKASSAPSGKMPLVADPDLTGVYIHEALGHPCEADLVAAGDSCLDGKLGQTIGSDIVTVVDDPTIRGGYGAFPIDDEGLNTREKLLIKNGVLTEYLNHRETAHHFGLEPNAGARAQDGLHHPMVRMSNTIIQGGSHNDLDELLEDIQYGVFACGSRGGQVDTGRGSFQFSAQESWLIENGELTTPLKDVSVSGMTLEILKNVDGLTKDAKIASPGFCGKGQTVPVGDGGPLMRIREALVG